MSSPEEAAKAIEMFNETDFNGRTIQVKLDKFAGEPRNYNFRAGYRNNSRGGYSNGGRKSFRGGRNGYSSRSPQRGVDIIVGNVSIYIININIHNIKKNIDWLH